MVAVKFTEAWSRRADAGQNRGLRRAFIDLKQDSLVIVGSRDALL